MIALLIITDGREDYLRQTVPSARSHLVGPITERVMYDDTGDDTYRDQLRAEYPDFTHINAGPRQGFGGAIRSAWAHLAWHSQAQYVFHLEQDFTFNRQVDLDMMRLVLVDQPNLVQLALRRQAWNDVEKAAGGVVECQPDEYSERDCPCGCGASWLEHRLFFTTNPSLYRMDLVRKHPWPRSDRSEGKFTAELVKSPKVRFGYWGARDSGEWVRHIGKERAGVGY